MRRRLLALAVGFVLLIAMIPVTGFASPYDGRDGLIEATRQSYLQAQIDANQESFNGFCGRLTSYQLWNMGINSSLITTDGNKQFELYSSMKRSSTGYYICSYSAEEYTLERALNTISRNGTKNVYNLVVCFDWTNTEAGQQYGHSMVINGILNGQVYFVESFYTRYGGEEGNVVICSIPEFVEIFEDWTLFEGVIHFAGMSYADGCKNYPTDMFVRTRYDVQLRSQPCMVGTDNCKIVRSVSAGERLRVTSVLRNGYGEWYYLVEEGKQVSYLLADTTVVDRVNTEEIYLKNFELTQPKGEEEDIQMEGTIRAGKSLLGTVEIQLLDENGNEVSKTNVVADAYELDLDDLNDQVDFSNLKNGVYTVLVYGQTATAYIAQGKLSYAQQDFLLGEISLTIGDEDMPELPKSLDDPVIKNGWYWEDGIWYLYEQDMPVTGWYQERGVWYYLQENGAVTTGEAEIGDKTYHFSPTGAMCVGWLKTIYGIRYLTEAGLVATGWQTIDGSRYYFAYDGNMQVTGTRMDGTVKYTFHADGKAVPSH